MKSTYVPNAIWINFEDQVCMHYKILWSYRNYENFLQPGSLLSKPGEERQIRSSKLSVMYKITGWEM